MTAVREQYPVATLDDVSSVVSYYESWESRAGYRLFLRGEKHLGWHPHGLVLPDTIARRLATLRALDGLNLTDVTTARVLDAGCGLGGPSRLIASLGPHVDGVSVVPFEVRSATATASKEGACCEYHLMDYHNLSFAENSFDGVYTIETLSHAYDITRVLAEFSRVLRPGASLSLCEYTMAPDEQFDPVSKSGSDLAISTGSLRAMPDLRHGAFAELLGSAGFANVHVETHTTEVLPSLRRLRRWSHHPARVLARLGLAHKFKNTMVADSWASLFEKDLWRYVTVTATKPQRIS